MTVGQATETEPEEEGNFSEIELTRAEIQHFLEDTNFEEPRELVRVRIDHQNSRPKERKWTGKLTEPEPFNLSVANRPVQVPKATARKPPKNELTWTGELTEPKPFNLLSDQRSRRVPKAVETPPTKPEVVVSWCTLLKLQSGLKWTGELTQPTPFTLSTSSRAQFRRKETSPIVKEVVSAPKPIPWSRELAEKQFTAGKQLLT